MSQLSSFSDQELQDELDRRKVDRERFRSHLERRHEEVKNWPDWKRNLLGPHYSDRKQDRH